MKEILTHTDLMSLMPNDLGWPEYVERVQLGDLEMYRMYMMKTEGSGILYYSIAGTLNKESERFLNEQAEWNER